MFLALGCIRTFVFLNIVTFCCFALVICSRKKKSETKKKHPEIVKQHPKPQDNTRLSSNELKIKEAIAAGLLLERDDEQTINECPSNWGVSVGAFGY